MAAESMGGREKSRRVADIVGFGFDAASVGVLAVVLGLVFTTFLEYGITWDETWHLTYGDQIVEWFATGGADRSALSYRYDYFYGGAFDVIGALARRLSPLSGHDTVHLVGALVGVVGLIGAWRLARLLSGPVAGFSALLLLVATPAYYGHMFNNPKDLPFAVGYIWALHCIARWVLAVPRVPGRSWVTLAVVLGLAASVRIAGLLTSCYLLAMAALVAIERGRRSRSLCAGFALAGYLGKRLVLVVLGAWAVMVACWPWALLDPLRRPFLALGRMTRFTIHRRSMPFAGEDMLTTEPRWDYLLHYFGLKLPVVLLALVVAGGVLAVVRWRHAPVGAATPRRRHLIFLMGMAIVIPPLYAIVARSSIYDGLRHFLFLVPPLCVVAGVTAVQLSRMLAGRASVPSWGLYAVVFLLCGRTFITMKELHPHQYVFFNRIAGGLPGAHGRYDTDYYGNSYKEAYDQLLEYLWRFERETFLETIYTVKGCIPNFVAENYLAANVRLKERQGPPAQFYVGYTRGNCHMRHAQTPILLTVERQGTLLNLIRDLRPGGAHRRSTDPDTGDTPFAPPPPSRGEPRSERQPEPPRRGLR